MWGVKSVLASKRKPLIAIIIRRVLSKLECGAFMRRKASHKQAVHELIKIQKTHVIARSEATKQSL